MSCLTINTFFSIPVGIRYMMLSAFAFSVMAIFVKAAGLQGVSVVEMVAARSVVSFVLCFVTLKRLGISVLGQRRGLLFARGFVGFFALVCVYYSLTHLPLAEATVLQYLHPMFTVILAFIFLRETTGVSALWCVLLSFIGLVVMLDISFESAEQFLAYDSTAIIAGILGAFGSAIAYTLVRKLNNTEHPLVIIFYFPMVCLPICVVLLWGHTDISTGISWFYLLMIGITTQLGQVGLTKSMQTETAGSATSFSYLQVVFAIAFGFLIFGETPNVETLIGTGLIIAGAYINVVWRPKTQP